MNKQRRERRQLLLLSAISMIAMGSVLYLQRLWQAPPCPLCILQRYMYLLIALLALAGAVTPGKPAIMLAQGLVFILGLGGIAAASRHIWLLTHPFLSCHLDTLKPIINRLPLANLLPAVFKAVGSCNSTDSTLVGLSLPVGSLVGYLLTLIMTGRGLWTLTLTHRDHNKML